MPRGQVGPGLPRPHVPGLSPTTQLILLATVHGDPAGYDRAWRFLEHWRPDAITVEISPFSVRYRERMAGSWRRRLQKALQALPPEAAANVAVARAAAQASLPFEYRVARDWGRAHGVAVKLLDAGGQARRHLPRYTEELLSPENVRLLWETGAPGTLEEFVAREFHRARRARAGQLTRLPDFANRNQENGPRERLWARRLRRLLAENRKIVHLGGWEHLVPWPDSSGLCHLLADLKPAIMLLEEANRFVDSKGGWGLRPSGPGS
ncbi:MAG: hypothetical protein ACOC8G_01805 [Thermodesulfobacteriota bacterium]